MDAEQHRTPGEAGDELLVRRAERGDGAAFEALCARIEGPLFGYARGIVRQAQEAEDIVQETLLRLYRLIRGGRYRSGSGNIRALAFGMAHNLAIDCLRRRQRIVPLDSRRAPSAQQAAEVGMLRDQIDRALGDLPESQRAPLLLREFGGLAYNEIAATLGVSLDEVKIRIYRARKRLAQLLDRDGQYIGETRRGM